MHNINILIGFIRIMFIKLFLFNELSFKFPVKFSKNATIGCRRKGKIILGKRVSLNNNSHCYATKNAVLSIGNYTGIGDNNVIVAREKIVIGNNVMIGPNVCIYDHDHVFNKEGIMRDLGFTTAPVIIEDNVWIAAGVIILKGVTIGSGSVVAAGTIVTKDIPQNSVVYNKKEMVIKPRF